MLVSSKFQTWTHFKVICRLFLSVLSKCQPEPCGFHELKQTQLLRASEGGERSPPGSWRRWRETALKILITSWKSWWREPQNSQTPHLSPHWHPVWLPGFAKLLSHGCWHLTSYRLMLEQPRVAVDPGDRQSQTDHLLHLCNSVCNHQFGDWTRL